MTNEKKLHSNVSKRMVSFMFMTIETKIETDDKMEWNEMRTTRKRNE